MKLEEKLSLRSSPSQMDRKLFSLSIFPKDHVRLLLREFNQAMPFRPLHLVAHSARLLHDGLSSPHFAISLACPLPFRLIMYPNVTIFIIATGQGAFDGKCEEKRT